MNDDTIFVTVSKIKRRWLRRLLIVGTSIPFGVLNFLFVLLAYVKAVGLGLIAVPVIAYRNNAALFKTAAEQWRKP